LQRIRLAVMSTLRRSVAVFVAMMITALLLAPSAAAQPPFRLPGYLTDNAGALNDAGRAAIQSATGKLYADRRIRLWVAFVDTFSGQSAVSWAQDTRAVSDLGDFDAVLAVATVDHSYALLVPRRVQTINAQQVDDLRRNQIEPALGRRDWSAAAVAAADGLDRGQPSASAAPLLYGLGIILLAVVALYVFTRYRRRRRRAAELAAAKRVDATDPDALAGLSLGALDDLSRWKVVDVDNAVRTSANELALTIEEFGEQRTEPFTRAVDNAKAALATAFTVRQQLDDAIPETNTQRRQLLTEVIVAAARADVELESQREAFEEMRDLVVNAPSRVDALTQQVVDLTARIEPAEKQMAELRSEFDYAALASVATNVATAKDRLAFADQNLTRAREQADRPVSGEQSILVDAVRAAESSLGQARSLLDAVDSAAGDIRRAVAALPSLIADIQSGIEHADTALRNGGQAKAPHLRDLARTRDAAAGAVDAARAGGSADPLGSFTSLSRVDADLNRLLATVAEEQAAADRLTRTLDQALFTAQSRVRAVSEYIDTRRGSVGPEARTRLAEASRQIDAAQDTRTTDLNEAVRHAHQAASLAAQAQSLAESDVNSAQLAYTSRYGYGYGGGGHMGAMMGGIIIGDLLGNAMGGGFGGDYGGGGWGPTSFGGSDSSDGGFMGGGGRF
jgi:predicted  nucleic acid-binding Zn-ribbon protein